jgi:hypothetical protein
VYLDRFQNCVDVLEHCGGAIGPDPALVEQILQRDGNTTATAATDELTAAKEGAIEEYLAMVFLLGADRNRYGKLVEDLENAFTQGNDNYPRSVTGAYAMLMTWKQRNIVHVLGSGSEGVSFTNVEGSDSDDENNTEEGIALTNDGKKPAKRAGKAHITCFNCNEMGHDSNECPKERLTGKQHLMAGVVDGEFEDDGFEFTFHQGANRRSVLLNQPSSAVLKDWILLDNQSTVDVFYNERLLKNIRKADSFMNIHCNVGVTSTNLVGDLPRYGEVWYHPSGIANILSLARVKDRHRVTFDSTNGNQFVIHKNDGTSRKFHKSRRGLYFRDTKTAGMALVTTVLEL